MSKLFNIRPRWRRNLLLARILLFAIPIVLSSSGEDIGHTIEESLAAPNQFSGGIVEPVNVRDLQSKSAKSSKSNKSNKSSKGSKSKASKASGSKSKSTKAASKISKSSDKSKASKSKAAKSISKSKAGKSKSKASKSKSKIGKSLKSLDSGEDDTDESRDGNSSSDSIEETTNTALSSEDNEQSDSVETSSLNRDDVDYIEEEKYFDSSSYSGSNGEGAVVEQIDIISNEEAIVSTKDGKTYNAIQLPVSSEEKINIDTTHLDGDFMEERIDESEDIEVDIDEIMTEIIEESRAFEKDFDESDVELDPSRESVE